VDNDINENGAIDITEMAKSDKVFFTAVSDERRPFFVAGQAGQQPGLFMVAL